MARATGKRTICRTSTCMGKALESGWCQKCEAAIGDARMVALLTPGRPTKAQKEGK